MGADDDAFVCLHVPERECALDDLNPEIHRAGCSGPRIWLVITSRPSTSTWPLQHLVAREDLDLTLRGDPLKSNTSEAFDAGIVEERWFVDRCDLAKVAYYIVRSQLQAIDAGRK